MRLHYIVLQMYLDIEHALKVKILTEIRDNSHEGGYTIDFLLHCGLTLLIVCQAIITMIP